MIIAQLYTQFKHFLTDAHRALTGSPPAAPTSERVALVNWAGSTRILAVA